VSDALTGNRQFVKDIPNTILTWDPIAGEYNPTNGWNELGGVAYYETYWDTSAYSLNDLTYYPITSVLQDGQPYINVMVDNTNAAEYILDIVSQEKLDINETVLEMLQGNLPGQPLSKHDFTQILMCQFRLLAPTLQFNTASIVTPINLGQFGSLEPTAASKLWIYRIVYPTATTISAGDTFSVPATRFIMNGAVAKESELEYMMRLKRSFELAQ